MNKRSLVTLAFSALVAGVSAASAASGGGTSSRENVRLLPSDSLDLSQRQQQAAWNDLYMGSLNQKTPPGFNTVAGASMPPTVVTAPVTHKAVSDIPVLKPYTFAMIQKKLVIVNPADHKIAAVIAE